MTPSDGHGRVVAGSPAAPRRHSRHGRRGRRRLVAGRRRRGRRASATTGSPSASSPSGPACPRPPRTRTSARRTTCWPRCCGGGCRRLPPPLVDVNRPVGRSGLADVVRHLGSAPSKPGAGRRVHGGAARPAPGRQADPRSGSARRSTAGCRPPLGPDADPADAPGARDVVRRARCSIAGLGHVDFADLPERLRRRGRADAGRPMTGAGGRRAEAPVRPPSDVQPVRLRRSTRTRTRRTPGCGPRPRSTGTTTSTSGRCPATATSSPRSATSTTSRTSTACRSTRPRSVPTPTGRCRSWPWTRRTTPGCGRSSARASRRADVAAARAADPRADDRPPRIGVRARLVRLHRRLRRQGADGRHLRARRRALGRPGRAPAAGRRRRPPRRGRHRRAAGGRRGRVSPGRPTTPT